MHRSIKPAAGALLLSLILVACGGGGGDDSGSSTTTAAASSAAATSTAASSAAATSAGSATSTASTASAATTGTWTPSLTLIGASNLLACSSGNYGFNASSSEVTAGAASLYSVGASNLRLYDGSSDCTGTNWAISFNGSSFAASAAVTAGTSLSGTTFTRYIKIPYTSAATTSPTITVKYGNTSSACSAGQIVITDSASKVLAVGACGGTGAITAPITLQATDTVTKGSSGAFFVYYTRVTDTTGGLRVWSIDYSY